MTLGIDCSCGAIELATKLLGCRLLQVDEDGVRGGRIVETEAYPGGPDRASHSFDGRRTARNEAMYLAGGHIYVYLIYGIHHCVNIVSGSQGSGEAVLVRSLVPEEGICSMRVRRPGVPDRDLCRGPGRLTRAMGIDLSLNGSHLDDRPGLQLHPPRQPVGKIVNGPRIGVASAGSWSRRCYRFGVDQPTVWSRPFAK